MTELQLDCALDLMRRLPPQQIEKNLSDLIDLVPDLCESTASSLWIEIISKDKLSKPLPASLTYTETPTGVKDEVLHLETD